MFIINKRKPKTEPLGTPWQSFPKAQLDVLRGTNCIRSATYEFIGLYAAPRIPYDFFTCSSSIIWSIVSDAVIISRSMRNDSLPLSTKVMISDKTRKVAVFIEGKQRYTNCRLKSKLFFKSILDTNVNFDSGRYFVTDCPYKNYFQTFWHNSFLRVICYRGLLELAVNFPCFLRNATSISGRENTCLLGSSMCSNDSIPNRWTNNLTVYDTANTKFPQWDTHKLQAGRNCQTCFVWSWFYCLGFLQFEFICETRQVY